MPKEKDRDIAKKEPETIKNRTATGSNTISITKPRIMINNNAPTIKSGTLTVDKDIPENRETGQINILKKNQKDRSMNNSESDMEDVRTTSLQDPTTQIPEVVMQ